MYSLKTSKCTLCQQKLIYNKKSPKDSLLIVLSSIIPMNIGFTLFKWEMSNAIFIGFACGLTSLSLIIIIKYFASDLDV